jgi:hypothetical protein
MQEQSRETSPRRIAVILGTSGSGRLLLDNLWPLLVTKIAKELNAIFVEEDELQRAADLPFVKELCRLTSSLRDFHHMEFERAVAMRTRAARDALEKLARQAGIAHSFRNVRGSALKTLLETVPASDITAFQPLNLFASAPVNSGTRVRPSPRHLVVGINDLVRGSGALLAAGELARGLPCKVTVLAAGDAAGDPGELARRVRLYFPAQAITITAVDAADENVLLQLLRQAGPDLLVLGASESLMEPAVLRQLHQQLRCPIFLVRQWPEYDDSGQSQEYRFP